MLQESCGSVVIGFRWEEGRVSDERAVIDFYTADGTAHAGIDFKYTEGTLALEPGHVGAAVEIPIVDEGTYRKRASFQVKGIVTEGQRVGQRFSAKVTITDSNQVHSAVINLLSSRIYMLLAFSVCIVAVFLPPLQVISSF